MLPSRPCISLSEPGWCDATLFSATNTHYTLQFSSHNALDMQIADVGFRVGQFDTDPATVQRL